MPAAAVPATEADKGPHLSVVVELVAAAGGGGPVKAGHLVGIGRKTRHQVELVGGSAAGPSGSTANAEDEQQVEREMELAAQAGVWVAADKEIAAVRAAVALALGPQDAFTRFGLKPLAGILLSGPLGVGKSTAVAWLAREFGARLLVAQRAALIAADAEVGGALSELRAAFASARSAATAAPDRPVLLWLPEIDELAPARDSMLSNAASSQIITQLLTLLDGARAVSGGCGRVLVIATCAEPNALDSALRRPGRLDQEFALRPPDVQVRQVLLEALIGETGEDVGDAETRAAIASAADATVGFVGGDLFALVREAAAGVASGDCGWEEALTRALVVVRPSMSREAQVGKADSTTAGFDSLAGLDSAVSQLRRALVEPLAYPELFEAYGLAVASGVLLHGPPGTGKTSLVRALSTALSLSFFVISGAALYSSYLGEAEAYIRRVFAQARRALPSLVFIDEVDTLVGSRSSGGSDLVQERVLSTLLNELDGVGVDSSGVLVVGATNRLDKLDDALVRPGRLGLHIEAAAVAAQVEEGTTGAELRNLVNQLRMAQLRDELHASH
ncbi:uncharacterized protein AMSG_01433 [Thecamonas trahens ATCC 50062]|uniref:AAA+ ATPase domain-containing protein n=1 Tax=Thecamonas trahens ATCC 50062 TaxID=461836 RepID=A0A0L0DQL5_THETB|nr:hypothetical protein AMSG_01433 [Thecamonas trahens ATCC 50062]KNC53723.1 hypothetical protein AMSG_01433 [Thecamonas trahens ATCC 50062]|eukprot:XP_013762037.1 hypothetical protein AMSG_01433 [Thecamonas trahens ATCC 50062]